MISASGRARVVRLPQKSPPLVPKHVLQLASQLAQEYVALLRRCVVEGEAPSTAAFAIGRKAVGGGLSVLDMARLHHQALLETLPVTLEPKERAQAAKAAEELFLATLTPFESTLLQSTNAALRVSEERYRTLFDNANDIIFTVDLEGNFTSINRAGERLSGYKRSEALAMNFTAVVAPEHAEAARCASQAKLLRDQLDAYQARPPMIAALPNSAAIAIPYFQSRRQANTATDAAAKQAIYAASRSDHRRVYRAAANARIANALATDTPFTERLVHFWANHFAISADKGTASLRNALRLYRESREWSRNARGMRP